MWVHKLFVTNRVCVGGGVKKICQDLGGVVCCVGGGEGGLKKLSVETWKS